MVEAKATADNVRNGTSVQVKYDGTRLDVFQETVALIRGLMDDLRKNEPSLHAAIITELALDPSILLGEEPTKEEAEESVTKSAESVLANLMSEGIIGKEMN